MKTDLTIARQPRYNGKGKSVRDLVGARHSYLHDVGDGAIRPFKARRSRHRLILLRIGSLAVECGGRAYYAEAGDAILVPAGEARMTFVRCPLSGVLEAEIFEFDHRTLAPRFANSPGWEDIAHAARDVPAGPLRFGGMAKFIYRMDRHIQIGSRFQIVLGEVFRQYRHGLPEFLRSVFYRPRWQLFMMLEKFVRQADGAAKLAAEYPGGMNQLRRDCRLYLGEAPETVLVKRRCQLATVWQRCGHAIDDVAKALGFSSTREFRCFYAGRMGRSWAEEQTMTPIAGLGPEDLVEILRPCWWPKNRPISVRIPGIDDSGVFSEREADQMEQEMVSRKAAGAGDVEPAKDGGAEDTEAIPNPDTADGVQAEVEPAQGISGCADVPRDPAAEREALRAYWAAEHAKDMEYLRAKRARIADELRAKAAEFFAMKCTGVEIIVPIFGELEIGEAMAA